MRGTKKLSRDLFSLIQGTAKWTLLVLVLCRCGFALDSTGMVPYSSTGGASAVWIFSNLSFTGMRAQAKGSMFWKLVTFVLGFPGTLLTLLVVTKGSERAYGIDMPRRRET